MNKSGELFLNFCYNILTVTAKRVKNENFDLNKID